MHAWTAICAIGLITAAEPAPVTVRVVKYAGLGQTVKQHPGKVIVVDFWSDTCIPCKKEFPRLVRMHRQYPAGSFAAISVSLDDLGDPQTRERVQKFLQSQDATFDNLILDEKPDVWQQKLGFDTMPCVIVFNAQGKIAKQFKDEFTYDDVEQLVKKLLGK